MSEKEVMAWEDFRRTGSVLAYLRYKELEREELKFEAGEELGIDKDGGSGDENR